MRLIVDIRKNEAIMHPEFVGNIQSTECFRCRRRESTECSRCMRHMLIPTSVIDLRDPVMKQYDGICIIIVRVTAMQKRTGRFQQTTVIASTKIEPNIGNMSALSTSKSSAISKYRSKTATRSFR
jgi:hypothetical protein